MMRLTYHDLVGSRVITDDGRRLGRVVDVVACPVDDHTLRITGLLVGYRALVQRIGRRRSRMGRIEVPWSQVAAIEGHRIRLSGPVDRVDQDVGGDVHHADPEHGVVGQGVGHEEESR
jgi:sporulation protein YlmC with PRC-barrel domain